MGYYKKIANVFDLSSKICAVITAASIVLSTTATVILFPLTVLFSLASGNWRNKFMLVVYNPIAWLLLVFYSLFLFGAIYSTATFPDILLILRKYDKFFLAIMFIPLFAEQRWRDYALGAFMAAILVLLIASYLRSYEWLNYGATGVVEIFKPSIEFNFLMAFASYLCLLKITSARCCRLIWGIFLVLIIHTVLFRSIGRSGYFVFGALMLLFFTQKFHWRGLVVAVVSIVLFGGLAFNFSSQFRTRINAVFSDIKTYQQSDNTSVGMRMTFVKNSLQLIKARPILGYGTGSFAKEYAKINPSSVEVVKNPHNEYLYLMVQFGIFGLIGLLLFFIVPWWCSQFLPELPKYIARGTILGIAIGCLANSWLLDVTTGHFYAYFIALSFAALPFKYPITKA